MSNLIERLRRLFGRYSGIRADLGQANLDFFNSLSGKLEVQLSEPAQPIGSLLNVKAAPEAELVAVRLHAQVFVEEDQDMRELTELERAQIVLSEPSVRLRGESGSVVEHKAPNGETFSVTELLAAIEETERRTRSGTEWLGGIDVHHCYFEGMTQDDDGVWEIHWGS